MRCKIFTISFSSGLKGCYIENISDTINLNFTSYIPLLIRVSERSLIF